MARLTFLLCLVVAASGSARLSVDVPGTVRASGKPVEDAVVWIDAPGGPASTKGASAVLNQRDLQFAPRVVAVQAGGKVTFPNQNRVFHNVFSYHDGTRFDLGLYPVGASKEWAFDKPGLSRVFCNIHPQMAAYIMVVDTPHFAVSDRAGRFTVRAVPLGTYRYHAWRAGSAILNGEINVGADEPFEVRWP